MMIPWMDSYHLHVLASVLAVQLFNSLSSYHLCITINWITINHLVGCYDKKVRVYILGVGDGKMLADVNPFEKVPVINDDALTW